MHGLRQVAGDARDDVAFEQIDEHGPAAATHTVSVASDRLPRPEDNALQASQYWLKSGSTGRERGMKAPRR
jgi:hypothetical protein